MDFNEIEKDIFNYVCSIAVNITKKIFEDLDDRLANERDKKRYRYKDKKKTSIKTVYGYVEFKRRYYFDNIENRYVFMLDEKLNMKKIGLFSENMANLILKECIDSSYKKASESVNRNTSMNISSVGAWKLVQQVGKNIEKDENEKIYKMNNGKSEGNKYTDVLFMEADGVWLKMQGDDRNKATSQEIKVATIYEGWETGNRHTLKNKRLVAGFENGKQFMNRTQATIEDIYDISKIKYKMMNSDGATWINPIHEITYHQLDQYHVFKAITKVIKNKKIRNMIVKSLKNKELEKMFDTIITYADSIDNNINENKEANAARELYTYFYNNNEGLIPYKEFVKLPEPGENTEYRNMGVQENQNCTLITMRMKNKRMSWSKAGANNLAKVLTANQNNELDKYIKETFEFNIPIELIEDEIEVIKPRNIKKKVGQGSPYIDIFNFSVPLLSSSREHSKFINDLINNIMI